MCRSAAAVDKTRAVLGRVARFVDILKLPARTVKAGGATVKFKFSAARPKNK